VVTALVASAPRGVVGLEPPAWVAYDCPGFENPKVCFEDVNDDGCFDASAPDVFVEAALEAGELGVNGSLVCPPGAGPLEVAQPSNQSVASWDVSGHVWLHGTTIRLLPGTTLLVEAGATAFGLNPERRMVLDGVNVRGAGGSNFQAHATGSLYFDGRAIFAPCDECSMSGDPSVISLLSGTDPSTTPGAQDLLIGDGAKLRAGVVWLAADGDQPSSASGANLRIGNRVAIQTFGGGLPLPPLRLASACPEMAAECPGGIEASNLRLKANGLVELSTEDGPIALRGQTRLHGMQAPSSALEIGSLASAVTIDQLVVKVGASIAIRGESIKIGSTLDADTRVSKLSVSDAVAGGIVLDAQDGIDLERARLQAPDVDLVTTGTTVDFRNGRVTGEDALTSTIDVEAGAGSTCDFTGSRFVETTLAENCGSVIGP
jgi:hypothetical protein